MSPGELLVLVLPGPAAPLHQVLNQFRLCLNSFLTITFKDAILYPAFLSGLWG